MNDLQRETAESDERGARLHEIGSLQVIKNNLSACFSIKNFLTLVCVTQLDCERLGSRVEGDQRLLVDMITEGRATLW